MNDKTKSGGFGRLIGRLSIFSDRTERVYLQILRISALVAGAILLIGTVLLLAFGIAMRIGNPKTMPKPISVTATDIILTPPPLPRESPKDNKEKPKPRWEIELSAQFRTAYFTLYNQKFAPLRRPEEAVLDQKGFFEKMFNDNDLNIIRDLQSTEFETDGSPTGGMSVLLSSLLNTMNQAASAEQTESQLRAYKTAKKVRICRTITRDEIKYVRGWNSYSTTCASWYEYPIGCPERRRIVEKVPETQCGMQFPEDIASPIETMRALQSRFFSKVEEKRASAQADAASERERIIERQAQGSIALSNSAKAFLAFLALMFLYLMVAIERHHRQISEFVRRIRNQNQE